MNLQHLGEVETPLPQDYFLPLYHLSRGGTSEKLKLNLCMLSSKLALFVYYIC